MQAEQLIIRPIGAEDYQHWAALWQAYLAFYETELPQSIYDTTFARLVADDGIHGRLAYVKDEPVGLVHYLYHAHAWKAEPVCYLQDLFATPRARGTGVGRALIETVYRAADAKGAPNVYWMTQEFNHSARLLYDRVATLTPFIKYARVL